MPLAYNGGETASHFPSPPLRQQRDGRWVIVDLVGKANASHVTLDQGGLNTGP